MKHFAIITKEEHTRICILTPNITVAASNCGKGTISIEISGREESGPSVQFLLDCGDFNGRYIEDYEEETQITILDSIETSVARDIARFSEQGYTYVGTNKALGEDPSDCFYLEDHKIQWQKDYKCTLEIFHQEAAHKSLDRQ